MTTKPSDVSPEKLVDVDHHTNAFNLDELTEWEKVRDRCPVAFNTRYGGFWMVSNYEGVATVMRDDETFSHRYAPDPQDGLNYGGAVGVPRPEGLPPLGVAEVDGSYHAALRRALNPFFSPQAVDAMRPFMEQAVTWFLDQKIADGRMDLVLDYASPVPAILTMKMFGLPCDDWKLYAAFFHSTMTAADAPGQDDVVDASVLDLRLREVVADRRVQQRDDLTSFLVHLEIDGSPLTEDQVIDILWNLIGGGVDTTTALTSWTLWHLAAHPHLRDQLIARPDLLPRAADEFLRYYTVNQTLARTVTRDVELCGQELRANDRVLISMLSANHDESAFERPDEVILDRAENRHLGFGLGPHRCVGSNFARTMFEVQIHEVLNRIPDYRVDVDEVHEYIGGPAMTGLVDLSATFTPGPIVGVDQPY
ncbi:MAG TPA: cytochrome P450 [Acidimicrobiia bacterium]|jgi:cytochrome P450